MKLYGIHIQTVSHIPDDELMGLMPLRYARSLPYRRREDRLRCLGAGILLHHVLGIDESALHYGTYRKPYVPGKSEFNLSHSGSWVVLAADSQPIGVDIEPLQEAHLAAANGVCTQEELAFIQQDSLVNFHILWTVKESILKACGAGLAMDPAQLHVLPLDGPHFADGKRWYTGWMLHDGHVIAWASEKPVSPPKFEEIRHISTLRKTPYNL